MSVWDDWYDIDGNPAGLDWAVAGAGDGRWKLQEDAGDHWVSTVHLGLDHRFDKSKGDPLIFETMVFLDGDDVYCDRYTSKEEAERGHRAVLQALNAGEFPEGYYGEALP